jgi:hypothetical protein
VNLNDASQVISSGKLVPEEYGLESSRDRHGLRGKRLVVHASMDHKGKAPSLSWRLHVSAFEMTSSRTIFHQKILVKTWLPNPRKDCQSNRELARYLAGSLALFLHLVAAEKK